MKAFRILLIMIITTLTLAAQFEIVKDVTELPGDLTAQRYGYKDVNGQWCAILKVHSDVKDMNFSSTGYEKHDYQAESGIYLVYLQPDTKNLRFMKQGYIAKSHNFPYKIKSNAVYQIDIKGIEEEKKLEDITINILGTPENSIIYLDGEEKGKIKSLKTSVGKHELKVTKDGFQTYSNTIEVSADNTMFDYKLEKVQEVNINIKSVPDGATVYIDGAKFGETEISDYYKSGTFPIKLVKEGYVDFEEKIEIKLPKFEKTFTLEKNSGSMKVTTSPEKGLDIYIDGKKSDKTSDATIADLKPGKYKIRAQSQYYETEEKEIEVIRGKTATAELKTEANFGLLTINTHEKAEVFLNGKKITLLKNIKLEPQKLNIEVKMKKAPPLNESYVLKKNDNKIFDLYPVVPTGTVQVAVVPTDAEIELKDDTGEKYTGTGSKIFDEIPIGTYKLTITKTGYAAYNKDIKVEEGKTVKETGIKLQIEEKPKPIAAEKSTSGAVNTSSGGDYIFVQGGKTGDFYFGKTEVTQAQWKAVMGNNPSYFKGDNLPVEQVSWYDAVEYCNTLSEMEGLTKCYSGSDNSMTCNFKANGYRLPSEAEWEYAAKGGLKGTKGLFGGYKYDYCGSNNIDEVGWYDGNSGSKTHAVATKKSNELGIYDMSGNVMEWCWDWYKEGKYRVTRGGSENFKDLYCGVASRGPSSPVTRAWILGFRVARTN